MQEAEENLAALELVKQKLQKELFCAQVRPCLIHKNLAAGTVSAQIALFVNCISNLFMCDLRVFSVSHVVFYTIVLVTLKVICVTWMKEI